MLLLLSTASACGQRGDDDGVCPPGEEGCDRIEGDCVAGVQPQGLTEDLTQAGKYRVWPTGRVPYVIDGSVGGTTKTRLLNAMDEWQTKSEQRVRFEPKTNADTSWVKVTAGDPKVSVVGYKKDTVSILSLRNPEYLTVVRHELGHVLGLHHEHKRADRGNHIQVLTQNIVDTQNCKYQFSVCTDCVPLGPYNPKSVMHYRTTELSGCRIDDKPVLLQKDGDPISHQWVLTDGDLAAIAELYELPPDAPEPPEGAGGAGGSGGAGGAGATDDGGNIEGEGDELAPDVDDGPAEGDGDGKDSAPHAAPAADSESEGGCSFTRTRDEALGASVLAALGLLALARRRRSAPGR